MLTVQLHVKLAHLEWKTGSRASFIVAAEDDHFGISVMQHAK